MTEHTKPGALVPAGRTALVAEPPNTMEGDGPFAHPHPVVVAGWNSGFDRVASPA